MPPRFEVGRHSVARDQVLANQSSYRRLVSLLSKFVSMTPRPPLPRATIPETSVPMKFPAMVLPPLSVSSSIPSPPKRLIASPSIWLLLASIVPFRYAQRPARHPALGPVQLDLQNGVQGPGRRQRVLLAAGLRVAVDRGRVDDLGQVAIGLRSNTNCAASRGRCRRWSRRRSRS